MIGSRVLEPEQNHARPTPLRQSHDFTEIQIEGENDSVFSDSLLENLSIRKFMEIFLAQVPGIMPYLSEPCNNSQRDSHVG